MIRSCIAKGRRGLPCRSRWTIPVEVATTGLVRCVTATTNEVRARFEHRREVGSCRGPVAKSSGRSRQVHSGSSRTPRTGRFPCGSSSCSDEGTTARKSHPGGCELLHGRASDHASPTPPVSAATCPCDRNLPPDPPRCLRLPLRRPRGARRLRATDGGWEADQQPSADVPVRHVARVVAVIRTAARGSGPFSAPSSTSAGRPRFTPRPAPLRRAQSRRGRMFAVVTFWVIWAGAHRIPSRDGMRARFKAVIVTQSSQSPAKKKHVPLGPVQRSSDSRGGGLQPPC